VRDLRALPKAHLHLHLELGMRPGTLADLSEKYGVEAPQVRGYGSFSAFSEMCMGAMTLLRERDDWERLADEMCADAAADGAAYIEPSFWAGGHRDRFPSDQACWESVIEVFHAAAVRHGISIGFMAAVDRVFDSPTDALKVAQMAVALRPNGVVGLGLHNDEVRHPPGDFVDAFRCARDGGLLSTPHAGELESGAYVRDSLDLLGADRIQHGVRAAEIDGLVSRMAEQGTCLDMCPTSNVMLSVVPSLTEHPLGTYLDAGVRCSVNADDPLLFGPGLLDEYELCRHQLGFDDARMAHIARCSIDASGAPDGLKARSLAGVDAWLDG
jgi:adenosine deaminase